MPVIFPNNAAFSLGELLKIVQLNGIDPIWAEVDTMDALITKKGSINWGQEVRFALNVDPGGGSVARLAQQSGAFAPGDKTQNILGKIYPKLQQITFQFERFHRSLSSDQAAAYIENAKQEYLMKTTFHKSFMALQIMGDGTGRQGKAAAFAATDVVAGANFTCADPDTPLKIKLDAADTVAGSVAHFLEGSMVSFVFADAIGVVRLLALSAVDAGTATTVVYDAFRVVEVDQSNNAIYVMPGRAGSVVGTAGAYVQTGRWCASNATGVVTFTPIKGLRSDNPAADAEFANPPGGAGQAATAVENFLAAARLNALIHPLYINDVQASALLQLGSGWTSATDLATIHDGILTGLDAHITNKVNTIHNINRAAVRQYLATVKDNQGKDLTFNTLFSFLAQNDTRNRNRKDMAKWYGVLMNPLVFSSLVSLSELDRRVTEGKGVRGEEGAKLIKFGDRTYQLDTHTSMRLDRCYSLAKGGLSLYDAKLEPVEVNGQNQFLTIANGQRINVIEAYSTLTGEFCVNMPRDCGAIRNFKFSKY